MNKRIIAAVAAGLTVAGAGLVAAPTASAYPAGSSPAIGVVGPNRVAPNARVTVRGFNFQPGCAVTLRVVGPGTTRGATGGPGGEVSFGFRAPTKVGTYRLRATQTPSATCTAETATSQIKVRARR